LIIRDALLLGRKRHESVDQGFQPLPVIQLTGLSSPDREARLIRENQWSTHRPILSGLACLFRLVFPGHLPTKVVAAEVDG